MRAYLTNTYLKGEQITDKRAYAEINLSILKSNIKELQRLSGENAELMCVVKADAYGHGAVFVSEAAISCGVRWLGVASLGEGVILRNNGVDCNILVFSHIDDALIETAVNRNISLTVYSKKYARDISKTAVKLGKTAKIHFKIDTGMARVGFRPEDKSVKTALEISRLPNIEFVGLMSHLAVAKTGNEFSAEQLARFLSFADNLEKCGLHVPYKHISNSGSIVTGKEFSLNMTRAGIILYGAGPDRETNPENYNIHPFLSLKSCVGYVKTVPAGTSIGYSRTYYTERESVIATIPIGYADGYKRCLSNKSEVLIHGKRAKLRGNVCMDSVMIDVTDIPGVKTGDEVVLIGSQGDESISAKEIAALAGTIEYEIFTSLSQRVDRVYIK